MRAALKTVEQVAAGEALAIDYAGLDLLLDPAGVAFFARERLLVVSDMHLEKASSFARRRVFLPPYDTAATLARLAAMVSKYEPKTIVSLGDAFHDDEASERLGDDAIAAIGAFARGRDMIWVSGNHDPSPPAGVPGETIEMLAFGDIVLRHIPEAAGTGYEISGHLHPSARLARHGRAVRRPCFASDGVRLVMPSFGVFTGGLNLRDEAFAGLFDRSRLRAYMLGADRVHVVGARQLVGG